MTRYILHPDVTELTGDASAAVGVENGEPVEQATERVAAPRWRRCSRGVVTERIDAAVLGDAALWRGAIPLRQLHMELGRGLHLDGGGGGELP